MSLGGHDMMSCHCGWHGNRSELIKVSRYDGYDNDGEPIWIEDFDACPFCKEELY